jgi:nucleotidyltransferase/DNA polymerase involved in DNA repair
MTPTESLLNAPGIGPRIASLLNDIGVKKISDLNNRNPEELYRKLEDSKGTHIDRCVLYTFRCAVYYASNKQHEPSKLKWWNWKD